MKGLQEAVALSARDRELLGEAKRILRQALPTATVLVYGSVARGTQGPESDYDILVLTDRPLSAREERIADDALFELELQCGAVLSTMYYGRDEWQRHPAMPFHVEVEKDGILL